ncbi:MAG: hypothetical protein ACJAVI_002594 [Candidatus Azotimanducaceae bacterium]|jgi:hypothetical protein
MLVGWSFGVGVAGWGGFAVAAVLMAIMYFTLALSLAAMSAVIPTADGGYSFVRQVMGASGCYLTGLAALIASWAYELTADGLKKKSEVDRSVSITRTTSRKLDCSIMAVRPFVNMSSDKEQEFFSDGITEGILNSLVCVKQLRVAGRTSSLAFKDTIVIYVA